MNDTTPKPNWYLIQTKPRQTQRAEEQLNNQGYTVFLPLLEVERVRAKRRILVPEPMFPNYLFIQLCRWTDNWHPIRSTRGVSRMVRFAADKPVPVPDEVIAAIQERAHGQEIKQWLKAGDRVQITRGCFHDMEAIFQSYDGEERVVLLLNFLHQQSRLKLPVTDIKAMV